MELTLQRLLICQRFLNSISFSWLHMLESALPLTLNFICKLFEIEFLQIKWLVRLKFVRKRCFISICVLHKHRLFSSCLCNCVSSHPAGHQVTHIYWVYCLEGSEAEFLDVIGTKVVRVFLIAIHSHLYILTNFNPPPPPPPLRKRGLKLLCYVNILHGNLES